MNNLIYRNNKLFIILSRWEWSRRISISRFSIIIIFKSLP